MNFCEYSPRNRRIDAVKRTTITTVTSHSFLFWPYKIVDNKMADLILSRIIEGHKARDDSFHQLVQSHGINRYWGDDYYRSKKNGASAQWQWDFWVSIVYSQRHD